MKTRTNTSVAGFVVSLIAAASLNGCLVTTKDTEVLQPHAQRTAVDFESEAALSTFAGAVQRRYARGESKVEETSWGVPFVYGSTDEQVLSENAFYNAQVQRADIDRDGTISGVEAETYASR